MVHWQTQILPLLPDALRASLLFLDADELARVEEIRLRCGQIPTVLLDGGERAFRGIHPVTEPQLREILDLASGFSNYAAADFLKQGYLTLPGGHRIGVAGEAVCIDGKIRSFCSVSSLAIRIARACPGCADGLDAAGGSMLIAGPPGCGKTTLLRDFIRQTSEQGVRFGVVDSRGEIAALKEGVPQLDVGRCTDVVADCRKADGISLLIRVMRPQWIAVDEITDPCDLEAIGQASFCGVQFAATAHAFCRDELWKRPLYRQLMELEVFRQLVLMEPQRRWKVESLC